MDWKTILANFLVNLGGTAVVVGALALLMKTWIQVRIAESVKHEYDKRLEDYKIHLLGGQNRRDSDRKLLESLIRELSNNGSIEFLRRHDFQDYFPQERQAELFTFLETWNDANHEFHDVELEEMRVSLYENISKFVSAQANRIFSDKLNLGIRGVPLDWMDKFPDRFDEARRTLNTLAERIVNSHQELVRRARKKLEV